MKREFKILFLLLIQFLLFDATAQIKTPATPAFKTLTLSPYYFYLETKTYEPKQEVGNGFTAQDVINAQNAQAMKMMGHQPPVVPPSDPTLAHQFIIEHLKSNVEESKNNTQLKELCEALNEAHSVEGNKRLKFNSINVFGFNDALNKLKQMAEGKAPASLKNAFYEMEKAHGNVYVQQNDYDNIINQNAEFIKSWMLQNHYDLKNNEAMHHAIQKFMSDTLSAAIKKPDSKMATIRKHIPYSYDYDDYKGEKDFRNYFVTKTLVTGTGQCSGLPKIYLLLAEALHAKCYMTTAPFHSFIKYPDNTGKIFNYEPTSGWNISDDWYSEHLFITAQAERSRIYLDTLNTKMIIGDCIASLGFDYMQLNGIGDGKFVNECIEASLKCFPKGNGLTAILLRSSAIAHQLERLLNANGIKNLSEMNKAEGATELYAALQKNEQQLKALGCTQLPDAVYEQLIQTQEFKGREQQEKGTNTKQKRSMFINTN